MTTPDVHPTVFIHNPIGNIFRIYMDTDFTRGNIKKKNSEVEGLFGQGIFVIWWKLPH